MTVSGKVAGPLGGDPAETAGGLEPGGLARLKSRSGLADVVEFLVFGGRNALLATRRSRAGSSPHSGSRRQGDLEHLQAATSPFAIGEAVLLATVQDDFLPPTAEDAHLHANLGETVVPERLQVELRELVQHVAIGPGHIRAIKHFHLCLLGESLNMKMITIIVNVCKRFRRNEKISWKPQSDVPMRAAPECAGKALSTRQARDLKYHADVVRKA
jgi:hypothetical protein